MYTFQGERRRTEIMKCDISEKISFIVTRGEKKTFIFDWLKSKSTFLLLKIYKFQ